MIFKVCISKHEEISPAIFSSFTYENTNLSNQNGTIRIYEAKTYLLSADLAEARKKHGIVGYCCF